MLASWIEILVASDDQCEPRYVFKDAKSACLACHDCRQKNKCPCSYFTDDSKSFFCFDSHAPDMPHGSDFHNEAMHCEVLTKGDIHACAMNAVQTTHTDETRLYSTRSNMNAEPEGIDRKSSIAPAAAASFLVLLSAVLGVAAFRTLRTRPIDEESRGQQMLSVVDQELIRDAPIRNNCSAVE